MSSTTSKLSEIVEVRSGYQVRKVSDDSAGTHYYLQVSDFNEDRTLINSENMQMISPPRNAEDYELQEGDVVFLSKGQNNFSFAIRSLPKPAIAASYFFVLKPKVEIESEYLSWFLNSDFSKNEILKVRSSGTHMPTITVSQFLNISIPVPDLKTQQLIAEISKLSMKQQRLLKELSKKKEDLVKSTCMSAVGNGGARVFVVSP